MAALGDQALQAVKAYYHYDPGIPLSARVVERLDDDTMRRDKVVFRGVRSFWVPGLLELPRNRPGPHPCVLLLHGWSGSKECWYDDDNYVSGGNLRRALLEAGFAVFALDAQMHGDRIAENDYAVVNVWPGDGPAPQRNYFTLYEVCEQTVRDYRRGLDYLATRPEIDMTRVGAFGYSMGAWQVFPLCAVDPRVRVAVAAALPTERPSFETIAPQGYVAGIGQPFLLQLGRQDEMATLAGGERLHDLLPGPIKRLIWYDGGHSLPVAYVPDATAWFAAHLLAPE
ncbi:MAG: alpha/beta fold hydrolase [Gemmatimonadota bacterium]